MPRKSTRREFLKGRVADDPAAACGGDRGDDTSARRGSAAEAYLVRFGRRAMACEFEVILNAGQYPQGTETAIDALDRVEALEAKLSIFRATSQLDRVNRLAHQEPVTVDAELFELLSLAQELSRQTEGAFDITAAPLWRAWGFARRAGTMPSASEIDDALRLTGSHLVALDPQYKTVRFLKTGVELNLGAIGKGYAVDAATEVLQRAGLSDFMVQGGLSSVRVRGQRGVLGQSTANSPKTRAPCAQVGDKDSNSPRGWSVGLGHPVRLGRQLAEFAICDRALGTSGAANQFFRHQGKRYGHILDPRTGWPAEGVLSATVLAPSAALADALSTAFYVIGLEKSVAFCRSRPELALLTVTPGGTANRPEIHCLGLRDEEVAIMDSWSRVEC